MRNAFVLMLAVALFVSLCPLVSAAVIDYRTAALAHGDIMHYYSMEDVASPGEDTAGSLDLVETAYGTGDTANIVYGTANLFGGSSRTMTPEANGASNEGAALYNNSGSFTATSSMTVEVIVKPTGTVAAGAELHVISGGAGTSRGNYLYQPSGTDGYGTWVGGERTPLFPAAVDKWYYLAIVLETNGADTDISGSYANLTDGGALTAITPRTHTGNYAQGGTNLAVGMHNNPNWAFVGSLDEVAFYSTALSQGDIDGNYAALTIPEPSTLALLGTLVLGGLSIRRLRIG